MQARSLLIVDDHVLVREALAMLLAQRLPGLHIHQASRLDKAMATLALQPGIRLVVLDLTLPDSQGLDTLRRMRQAWPSVPVVVLSGQDEPRQVLQAIECGAASYVAKSADAQALTGAIARVLQGAVVLPAGLPSAPPPSPRCTDPTADPLDRVFQASGDGSALPGVSGAPARPDGPRAPADTAEPFELSGRQRDVLRLLVQGLPNKLISRELDISEATVKTHLQAVFRRLGASNRTQAVLAVARLGLVL